MKKLSLVLAIVIALAGFLPSASQPAQASSSVEETTTQWASSDPCGGGQYPNLSQYVVVQWVCVYAGNNAAQLTQPRVTAKLSPCIVPDPSTCKTGKPPIIKWALYKDMPESASIAIWNQTNSLYTICMAHAAFFDNMLGDHTMQENIVPLCLSIGGTIGLYVACEYAWEINARFAVLTYQAEQQGQTIRAAILRNAMTAWASIAGVICTTPV